MSRLHTLAPTLAPTLDCQLGEAYIRWLINQFCPDRANVRTYDGTRLLSNLIQEPSGQFDNFCRMSSIDFEYLLQLIGPKIKKQDTVFRDSIPSKVRLAVTLRFLATGDSFKSLHYLFKISSQVISLIVPEVCKALCEALRSFVKSEHSHRMYMPEGNIDNVLEMQQLRSLDQIPIRTTENAREIRNEFASYFYSH
ncbi:hypothetical protein HW555_008584 [Spodoptera exigua]|uniref:Uncharacterized protein n=1 Tax=Spodoptera exigua TaxID=7107 RepID=A0A835L2M8_SPOEX|nr:hypothetical protein HW555_008584 [Spodoptera exigua]